mmetsp:Transcript_37262/g.110032  ORF Transcript_37262/g.110032 Transcript_37262/m.110032 type:complete len:208 (-) Transcript_37262:499-1122(-)
MRLRPDARDCVTQAEEYAISWYTRSSLSIILQAWFATAALSSCSSTPTIVCNRPLMYSGKRPRLDAVPACWLWMCLNKARASGFPCSSRSSSEPPFSMNPCMQIPGSSVSGCTALHTCQASKSLGLLLQFLCASSNCPLETCWHSHELDHSACSLPSGCRHRPHHHRHHHRLPGRHPLSLDVRRSSNLVDRRCEQPPAVRPCSAGWR